METYRLWILSGHVNEFEYWKRRFTENIPSRHRGMFECIYLSHPDKLRGHRRGKFIRVGSWYERRTRELDEIFEILRILEFEEIRSELVDKEEEERIEWHKRLNYLEEKDCHSCSPEECPTCEYDCPNRFEDFIKSEEMTI